MECPLQYYAKLTDPDTLGGNDRAMRMQSLARRGNGCTGSPISIFHRGTTGVSVHPYLYLYFVFNGATGVPALAFMWCSFSTLLHLNVIALLRIHVVPTPSVLVTVVDY